MRLERVVATVRFVGMSDDTSAAWAAGMLGAFFGVPAGIVAGVIAVALR